MPTPNIRTVGSIPGEESDYACGLISEWLQQIQTDLQFDLSHLVEITIETGYGGPACAAAVSNGLPGAGSPTNDGTGVGVAMATSQVADNGLESRVRCSAEYIPRKPGGNADVIRLVRGVFAHELAHVHDDGVCYRNIPEFMRALWERKLALNICESQIVYDCHSVWCEWAACRLSAQVNPDIRLCLIENVKGYFERARNGLPAYRNVATSGGSPLQSYHGIFETVYTCFKSIAAVMGHDFGISGSADSARDEALDLAGSDFWLLQSIPRIHKSLLGMNGAYGRWDSQGIFHSLREAIRGALRSCGLTLLTGSGGDCRYKIDRLP